MALSSGSALFTKLVLLPSEIINIHHAIGQFNRRHIDIIIIIFFFSIKETNLHDMSKPIFWEEYHHENMPIKF